MTADPFAGAGVTALGLAAARSVETSRTDRLIDDPLARDLFEAAGSDLAMRVEWPVDTVGMTDSEALHLHGSRYIGLRARVYDDALHAAAESGCRQAVLLGAGLDTRSHRLGLPADLILFELDAEALLAFKEETLAACGAVPRCKTVHVGSDLAGDWPARLRAAGFRRDLPTAWIAEGVMPYLEQSAQHSLIATIAVESGFGSTLAFDHVTGGDVRGLSQQSGIDMESLLVGAGRVEALAADLAARSWEVETHSVEALAERYGRDLSDPFGLSGSGPPWLQTAFVQARSSTGTSTEL